MFDDKKSIRKTELIHSGKANDVFATNFGEVLILKSTDRISAGNGEKTGVIPGKGKANNLVSTAAFKYLEEHGVPTHFLYSGNEPDEKIVWKADMLPYEVICRYVATGSFCKRYPMVPDGMIFGIPFVEFTYKSDRAGDPPIAKDTIWSLTSELTHILDPRELGHIEYLTARTGHLLTQFFKELGLQLVDFKLEFGRLPNGQIVVADEISPDTCRLRDLETGKPLDKDVFRKNLGDVEGTYAEVLRRLTASKA